MPDPAMHTPKHTDIQLINDHTSIDVYFFTSTLGVGHTTFASADNILDILEQRACKKEDKLYLNIVPAIPEDDN